MAKSTSAQSTVLLLAAIVNAGMVGGEMNPELTSKEQALLEGIRFDPVATDFHRVAEANGQRVAALVRSMMARHAIPDVRWRYFTDPELNPGGRKSREEVFVDNGRDRGEILGHPHFLKYLRHPFPDPNCRQG